MTRKAFVYMVGRSGRARLFSMLVLLTASLHLTGCATATKEYLVDRGRDAADIFSVGVGAGVGAQARVGMVHAGLLFHSDLIAFRGGKLVAGDLGANGGTAEAPLPIVFLRCNPGFYYDEFQPEDKANADPILRQRHKYFSAWSFSPLLTEIFATDPTNEKEIYKAIDAPFHPYFSQIDVACGALLGVHVGFNPGELVDFLLGWFGIDICDDDLSAARQEQRKQRLKQAQEEARKAQELAQKKRQAQIAKIPVIGISEDQARKKVADSAIRLRRMGAPRLGISCLLPDDFELRDEQFSSFGRKGSQAFVPWLSISSDQQCTSALVSFEPYDLQCIIQCGEIQVVSIKSPAKPFGSKLRDIRHYHACMRYEDHWLSFCLKTWADEPWLGPEFLIALMKSVEDLKVNGVAGDMKP